MSDPTNLAGFEPRDLRAAIRRAEELLLWEGLLEGQGPTILRRCHGWESPPISALVAHVDTVALQIARDAVSSYARRVVGFLATRVDVDAALDMLRDDPLDLGGHLLRVIPEDRLVCRDIGGLAKGAELAPEDGVDLAAAKVGDEAEASRTGLRGGAEHPIESAVADDDSFPGSA